MNKKYSLLLICIGSFVLKAAIESNESAKKILNQLYKDRSGYNIKPSEIKLITQHGSDSTYGEILPGSLDELFKELKPTYNDVFADLGSGVGRAVIYTYLTTPVKKSIGIELAKTRATIARQAMEKLKKMGKIDSARPLVFEEKDFLDTDLSDVTIAFINSVCYTDELLKKVLDKLAKNPKGLRMISSKKLPADDRFELKKEIVLPMSWNISGSPVYIYQLK